MGKDGQPKHRQAARELLRRKAQRQPAERLLIVCEGSKTEPLYLGEIRQQLRLPSANVQVQPAAYGTEPLRIVEYAERLFIEGQRALGIHARTFDRVVVVFDRDEHHIYHAALQRVAALNGRLKNDERVKVPFEAVVSVPCFELWLLLHFEDVFAPLHRDEAIVRLRGYLAGVSAGVNPRLFAGEVAVLRYASQCPGCRVTLGRGGHAALHEHARVGAAPAAPQGTGGLIPAVRVRPLAYRCE